jgi:penicillin-binding protein 1A
MAFHRSEYLPDTTVMHEPTHLISIKAALQDKRAPQYRKIIRWTWRLLVGGILACLLLFLTINFTGIPSFRELEDPNSALASEVLANNKDVLGRYFIENRVPVGYEELSPYLVNALIATEDERFRSHCGIDSKAVLRVVFKTVLLADQSSGGGSTITQQLAKMLYSDREFEGMGAVQKTLKLVYMKLREWITAVKLERSYTKEEIIAMYLNQFNFINNAYGISSAATVYFGKTPKTVNVQEAAMLIGMLKNPSYFNPNRFTERCIRRRWTVLSQMRRNNFLTEAQFDSIKVLRLDMSKFKKVNFSDDKAPYLCATLKDDLKKILKRPECRRADGSIYDLDKDGLRIFTTIDPAYQKHAEASMVEHMKKMQKRFFAVWKGRDPWKYRGKETTDAEIEARQSELRKLIRSGERYQALQPKYMFEVEEKIKKTYGYDLQDSDVERMLSEEKEKGSIAKLMSKGYTTAIQAATYGRIMKSTDWKTVKGKYAELQAASRKLHDVKVRMKVFSWNAPNFEKDTIMSPLDSLKYHRMFLQTGMLGVDPTTGEIKVWVGGINFKYFKYDHIRNQRQVGSTFKPFVYAAAITQLRISPCFEIYDNSVTIPSSYKEFTNGKDWTPKNSTGTYSGARMNLYNALKNSVNTASAYLMREMGTTRIVTGLCNQMGIDSVGKRIPEGSPAICLGAADLRVLEMTGAYASFANSGNYLQPYVIRKIEDKNGKILYRAEQEEREERVALSAVDNWVILDMLKYNVKGAPGLNNLKSEVGGKTGTTNDFTDGWFMGVCPRLVVGTWVGGEDRWIRFLNLADGQGSRMARPMFASLIGSLEKDPGSGYDANARFKKPVEKINITMDCSNYGGAEGVSDEEEFAPDIYGDEDEPGTDGKPTKPAGKKPDDGFGDND